MNNNGGRKSYGFNLKPDLSEYNKKKAEPVELVEDKKNAENIQRDDDDNDVELVKLATVGMAQLALDFVLYIFLWYFTYPILVYSNFILLQKYLNLNFEIFTPFEALNIFITLGAGMYYAYYLLTPFINEHSDAQGYEIEKQYFFQRIACYALFMSFVLYMSNMLNLETLQNAKLIRLFIIFYLLYVTATTTFKHFNTKISKH
ncbi:MAG: hypothetical protein KKB51_17945 [Candidatus Riflebacteria bacterium]|nr:hypothetical protein [Candidatus Riflebacteria bacterium]